MSKRFTDTQLWEEDWFIDLSTSHQILWLYMKDTCDHAGIWRPNLSKFRILFKQKVDLKEAIEKINRDKERVVFLTNGRLFLTGFIPFQYGGTLNLNSRMHLSVYQSLCTNGVKLTLIRPQIEVIDRVKDKDKEIVVKSFKDRGMGEGFDVFWKAYPRKVGKGAAEKSWLRLKPTEELRTVILKAIEIHKSSNGWTKDNGDYIPHPSTWLNQRRWEDEVEGIKDLVEKRKEIDRRGDKIIEEYLGKR